MRDVWDLVREIKAGHRAVLRDELAAGFAPNTACEDTGMTVLLGACEADDLEAVQLLLDAGADPNQRHHDGYDAYHATTSRAVREVLLKRGFSVLIDGLRTGRGLSARRVLAPQPLTKAWTGAMTGSTVVVEYCRSTFPPPSGEVIVRVGDAELRVEAGAHVTLPATAGPIEAAVELVRFVGEFQLRLWDEETIRGNKGDRAFWLPVWTSD